MAKVMVLGAGGFGISLAMMCMENGHEVTVWSHREEEAQRLQIQREQKKLLPGVKIPEEIVFTHSLEPAGESQLIIMAADSAPVTGDCFGQNHYCVCCKGTGTGNFL